MPLPDLLGHRVALRVVRITGPGAYLARQPMGPEGSGEEADGGDVVLLPRREVPANAKPGDPVDVFLHHDSEGRLVATTAEVRLEVGQVAFLEVTEHTRVGTFVDWGLGKELLVPFAEQTTEMRTGERYAIGLYVDSSGRLAGTMRVAEMVGRADAKIEWGRDEWVQGEAWRNDPDIGLFVIVEKEFVGLVPASEPHGLSRGEAASFRVANVLADGRIELSLRGHAHEELDRDAHHILEVLCRPGAPLLGDRSSPDEIRRVFGLSKKAFKRAAGRLIKQGSVAVGDDGVLRPR